jgi:hypothetical protein
MSFAATNHRTAFSGNAGKLSAMNVTKLSAISSLQQAPYGYE